MKTFYNLLANGLVASAKNNFVWFALTYWIYLETRSVISTGVVGGIFMVAAATSSFWLGSIVDNYKKKTAMFISGIVSLIAFSVGLLMYLALPEPTFTSISSLPLWIFVVILMIGTVAGNLYGIAIPTLITILVPEKERDKANGLFGTVMGISFSITSVASGLVLGFSGMEVVLISAIVLTVVTLLHLVTIDIPDPAPLKLSEGSNELKKVDIKGTIKVISGIPGLFALIFFTTFNNLLGGVFMALMDAYGLSLVSVQVWGILWGVLSFGFIFGGLFIAKYGLGKSPLKTLFKVNIVLWIISSTFTIQPSIILLAIGILLWICLVPFVEAVEQTIIQKVVPLERQGRVFGFAHSIEQAASPLTAFIIGPITQLIFIPFMREGGKGAEMIGSWFGIGDARGIALVFTLTGIFGLIVTLIAMRSKQYKLLAKVYNK